MEWKARGQIRALKKKKKSNITISLEASIFYWKLFSRNKLPVHKALLKSFILERR